MKQQLETRLQQLKTELASGQQMLADLEAKQANVRDTLLRIAGAIQVIEEELAIVDTETESQAVSDPGSINNTSTSVAAQPD